MLIYQIIVTPIEYLIGWVFNFVTIKVPQVGVFGAIFCVSMFINFLALPLYNVADSLQENERRINSRMSTQIKRIKSTFKGNERFMILQAYYRECNYHPIYAFRNSLSIFIEIPFFIAAYHFLSNCEGLVGQSFILIDDLSKPDVFKIGNFSLHMLPIFMTIINLVSAFFYTKGEYISFRDRVQTVFLPIFFLALLYNSPSGLVLYWILNNVFSLVKNILFKTKNPKKYSLILIISLLNISYGLLFLHTGSIKKRLFLCLILIVTDLFPLYVSKLKVFINKISRHSDKDNLIMTGLLGGTLCLFEGVLLSSKVIASSPSDFSYLGNTASPLSYIFSNFLVFLGFFLFWPMCISKLLKKVRPFLPLLLFVILISVICNALGFGNTFGTVTRTFAIENMDYIEKISFHFKYIPHFVFLVLFILVIFLLKFRFFPFLIKNLCFVLLLSIGCFSAFKVWKINNEFKKLEIPSSFNSKKCDGINDVESIIHLSRTGKNVVVFFLDRAQGEFFPSILDEIPDLRNQFKGFTYYPNTVSFSSFTLWGAPALLGGYEYSPESQNERPEELIKDKHNEALKIAPTLFSNAGYSVTVVDPPYPDYQYRGGNYLYDDIPNVKAYELHNKYSHKYVNEVAGKLGKTNVDKVIKKEIVNFIVMESLFPNMRNLFYNKIRGAVPEVYFPNEFIDTFSGLYYLNELTCFDSDKDNYVFFDSDVTHSPLFLDEKFEKPSSKKHYCDSYKAYDDKIQQHFQVNCAAYKAIGRWLEYLKKNQCYDNTRIIIVSDHGGLYKALSFENCENVSPYIMTAVNSILLYKDFNNCCDISFDKQFMVNADTLFLSIEGLGIPYINPFTNKELKQEKDFGINIHLPSSSCFNQDQLGELKLFPVPDDMGYFVNGDIFSDESWMSFDNK